jgi:hypothetical protein
MGCRFHSCGRRSVCVRRPVEWMRYPRQISAPSERLRHLYGFPPRMLGKFQANASAVFLSCFPFERYSFSRSLKRVRKMKAIDRQLTEIMQKMIALDTRYKDIEKEAVQKQVTRPDQDYLKLLLLRLCYCLSLQQGRSVDEFRSTHHSRVLRQLSRPDANVTSLFLQRVAETSTRGEQLHHEVTAVFSTIEPYSTSYP